MISLLHKPTPKPPDIGNLPTTLPYPLRPYQLDGIRWLRHKKRAMLLDEAGLGKTIQAIIAATSPVLVACPSYLVRQWQDEILSAYPTTTVAICEDDHAARQQAIYVNADWTVINIEMLRTTKDRDTGKSIPRFDLTTQHYETFIIDESHHLRGHSAKQSQRARTLAKYIPNVFMLTASPIKKECDDLFMQLSILDELTFRSYNTFLAQFCKTVDIGWNVKVCGPRDPALLSQVLAQYSIKRTYESTNTPRPEKIPQDIVVTPSALWYAAYRRLRKTYRLADITFESAGEMMTTLRQLTFQEKVEKAKEIYEDNPHTVFFVYYRRSAQDLATSLRIPYIDGSMLPKDRAVVAKSGGSFVATISALSEGLDLSHLHTACFVETTYDPGTRDQAIWRLVRWNKNLHPVRIFNLYVKDTVDTTIAKVLKRRGADERSVLREELLTGND